MAKTHLDQLVNYPAEIIKIISDDKYCVGLTLNKKFDLITDEDKDNFLDKNIFDYQYVDDTTTEASAYIMVEMEVPNVENRAVKDTKIFVTVACHKNFMKLDSSLFPAFIGNRRDNIARYVDKLINDKMFLGIGKLSLSSAHVAYSANRFTARQLIYEIPDFNIRDLVE